MILSLQIITLDIVHSILIQIPVTAPGLIGMRKYFTPFIVTNGIVDTRLALTHN